MSRLWRALVVGSGMLALCACSDGDGGTQIASDAGSATPTGDGGVIPQSDGGTPAQSDAGTLAQGDGGIDLSCIGGGQEEYGSCTAAEVKEYGTCVASACKSEYASCFGPGYASGQFSGPCSSYLSCTSQCSCGDQGCYSACTVSTECSTCMRSFARCSSGCLGKLTCALEGDDGGVPIADAGTLPLPDAGFDLSKTCADLRACCDSLSDLDAKGECSSAHGAASTVGDVACSALVTVYCP